MHSLVLVVFRMCDHLVIYYEYNSYNEYNINYALYYTIIVVVYDILKGDQGLKWLGIV